MPIPLFPQLPGAYCMSGRAGTAAMTMNCSVRCETCSSPPRSRSRSRRPSRPRPPPGAVGRGVDGQSLTHRTMRAAAPSPPSSSGPSEASTSQSSRTTPPAPWRRALVSSSSTVRRTACRLRASAASKESAQDSARCRSTSWPASRSWARTSSTSDQVARAPSAEPSSCRTARIWRSSRPESAARVWMLPAILRTLPISR